MKEYEAQRELEKLRYYQEDIVRLERLIEEIRCNPLRSRPLTDLPSTVSPDPHSVEIDYARIAEIEQRIRKIKAKAREHEEYVASKIERVEDADQRRILELRYLRFYKWGLIIKVLNYSKTSVFRKHQQAIKAYCKRWD